jgi:hypothetical protein
MSGLIFDKFTDLQNNIFNTSINSSGSTQWGPSPSSRSVLYSSIAQSIKIGESPGSMSIIYDGGSPMEMSYTYDSSYDLSGLITIGLTLASNSGLTNIKLELIENSQSQIISGNFSSNTITWPLKSFNLINIHNISSIIFIIDQQSSANVTFGNLFSEITCFAKDTNILMADGTLKLIQEIARGDFVAGNPSISEVHQVAKINTLTLQRKSPVDIVKFRPGSLGNNLPNQSLTITGNHPIIFRNARRPAKCFNKLPGITYYKQIPSGDILNSDHNGENSYKLYDLQFDHDGTFVTNGIIVQSRCPRSDITPLPQELYFNKELYCETTQWDSENQKLPLDQQIINL